MSLLSLRELIRAKLETEVSALAKVYTHGGRFDLEELKRYAVQAPCAVVGVLSVPSLEYDGGQCVAKVEWGCFVVASASVVSATGVKTSRDANALILTEALLGVITPLQRWGDTAAHAPESIKGANLYSGKLDNTGVALWAITWTQGYDVNSFDMTALDDFLLYQSTIQLSDDDAVPVAEDTVELEAS